MATATQSASPIGRDTPRVDGPLKVTGMAQYTSDFHFPGLLYAVPVEATIANGRITKIDAAAAEKMPGVRAIFHHGNIGKIFRSALNPDFSGIMEERRPPFEDDVVRYYGQYVAVAVAETFETAKAAADAVCVTFAAEKPNVDMQLVADDDPATVSTTFGPRQRLQSERGDAESAFNSAPVKLDETYVTPTEAHNPLELHSTTAIWDGDQLTLYESSQGVFNLRVVLAQMFGLPTENVRVITKFVGSGFGSKLFPWTQCPLAAAAARILGKPVKLVVSRKMMFQTTGHRPHTQQRVRLGVTPEGKLVSLQHDYIYTRSMLDEHHEDCGEPTPFMYSVPNLRVTFGRARRNIGSGADMRGPGAVPGLYATESALNELAHQLKIDPVKLRVINEPKFDESLGVPFSSRTSARMLYNRRREVWLEQAHAGSRLDAARRADARLGHGRLHLDRRPLPRGRQRPAPRRWHGPRRLRHAGHRHWHLHDPRAARRREVRHPARKSRSRARRHLAPRGPALRRLDGHGFGHPGRLRRRRRRDRVAVGDRHRNARLTVRKAQARRAWLRRWPGVCETRRLRPRAFRSRTCCNGPTSASSPAPAKGRGPSARPRPKFSTHSFGCHFAEVTWQPEIARLRVGRVVSVIDAGRIINPLAGRNQIEGAVVMGIGMALFEHTSYDPVTGAPINSSLADYVMTVNADAPPIEVHFLDYPDKEINQLGARGIGEIGLAGIAAALTDAVHHATGVRVRELPVKIEDLLA